MEGLADVCGLGLVLKVGVWWWIMDGGLMWNYEKILERMGLIRKRVVYSECFNDIIDEESM